MRRARRAATDVDLLVAGAGGGLAGALRAAELGMRVLVVEADRHYLRGNNTAMSTAMVPGAGSRYQREAGIADSPECFLADIERKTGGTADPVVARALAEVSAELVEWLADRVGLPLELAVDVHYPGHSVPRVHTVPGRHGALLLDVLSEAARRHERIDLLVPCRLVELHPADEVVRAVARHPDGTREEIIAAAALLATNGYGANAELVRRHLPDIAAAIYHGGSHSTGDALRIGAALGARIACLDAYQGHAGLSATARTLVTWTTVMHGGFLVNRDGRRFGDETSGYSEYASVLAGQPGATGWIVFDRRIHELSTAFVDYRDVVESGAVHVADTAEELARAISVPAGALRAELAEAAAVATGEKGEDRFGRSAFEAPLTAPLRAVRVLPALFHTQGGLVVDEHARVIGQDGEPIAGVYASGGAAVGISGQGASGYLGGNGLLPALGLAYLAAGHVARTVDGGRPR